MAAKILREITPLTESDCFIFFTCTRADLDFPLHYHEELEINFFMNASGAKRMVGDHIGELDDFELVLIGSGLQHGWYKHKCVSDDIRQVTIQFHPDLFDRRFLQRHQMGFIRTMFEKSVKGIAFSRETAVAIMPRLLDLPQKQGFDSVIELMSILHDLSTSRHIRTLSDGSFGNNQSVAYNSRRVGSVMQYLQKNFDKKILLSDVAKIAGMTEVALSRFFKLRTGNTFIDTLNEVRLGHASRLLIDSTQSITEIAYKCGFNNISNFNRLFRKKKQCTPKEFRRSYTTSGERTFV
ncbi:MAG: AraC family transcriptional regulator [Chitinophagaceae bacterium]